MKHHLDIQLLPNEEISIDLIWSRLYSQLHLAFVGIKDDKGRIPVGVSFPNFHYDQNKRIGFLGDKLRIFSPEKKFIENINLDKWKNRLDDYIHKTNIQETPLDSVEGYACYAPKRLYRSAFSRARRYAERHPDEAIDVQELAKRMFRQADTQGLPFLELQSLSNGNPYRLYIEEQRIDVAPQGIQYFNTFGLSTQAYLPLF